MRGWQVKLCDPLVTHRPYLSALEIQVMHYNTPYKFIFITLLYSLTRSIHAILQVFHKSHSLFKQKCGINTEMQHFLKLINKSNTVMELTSYPILFALRRPPGFPAILKQSVDGRRAK